MEYLNQANVILNKTAKHCRFNQLLYISYNNLILYTVYTYLMIKFRLKMYFATLLFRIKIALSSGRVLIEAKLRDSWVWRLQVPSKVGRIVLGDTQKHLQKSQDEWDAVQIALKAIVNAEKSHKLHKNRLVSQKTNLLIKKEFCWSYF